MNKINIISFTKVLFIIFGITGCATISTQNHCPKTKLINFKGTKNDKRVLRTAKKRCVVHYKNSPCLKVLIRKKAYDYHAICGDKE